MKQALRGFTIVELLIVIAVIAILASITLVAYNRITARAVESEKAAKLQHIKKALDLYAVNNDKYPTMRELGGTGETGASLLGLKLKDVEPTGFAYPGYGMESFGPTSSGATGFHYYAYQADTSGCADPPQICKSYQIQYWDKISNQAVTLRGSL